MARFGKHNVHVQAGMASTCFYRALYVLPKRDLETQMHAKMTEALKRGEENERNSGNRRTVLCNTKEDKEQGRLGANLAIG